MIGFTINAFSVELMLQIAKAVNEALNELILLMLRYVNTENIINSIDACCNFLFMTLSTLQMLDLDG